jgi:hypothetical protein
MVGHVYVLYPQYIQVPGCDSCPVPTMILVKSSDNGATWKSNAESACSSAQFDPQIVVDLVIGVLCTRLGLRTTNATSWWRARLTLG